MSKEEKATRASQTLGKPDVKKHSVRFDSLSSETDDDLFSTVYILKQGFESAFGMDLEDVKRIKVTVEVIK